MSTGVGDIYLNLKLNAKELPAALNKIATATRNTASKIEQSFAKTTVGKFTQGLRTSSAEFNALGQAAAQAKGKVESLIAEQAKQRGEFTNAKEYKELEASIAQAKTRLDGLIEEQIEAAEMPMPYKPMIDALEEQIDAARLKIEQMDSELREMGESGATEKQKEAFEATAAAIRAAEEELRYYNARLSELAPAQKIRGRFEAIANAGRRAFSGISKAAETARKTLGKIPFLQKIVNDGFKGISKNANKMKRGLAMGTGIRGLVRLGLAGAAALYSIRLLRQGLENLVQYDANTVNSINSLKASLLFLKNALASAFAPIINIVAPILSAFIDKLARAANAVAQFIAALTGRKTAIIAKKTFGGISSGADNVGKSAKNANKEAKKLQRTLMGFDKINKLDAKDKGSGNGSGGGSGSGGGGAADMFETSKVPKKIKALADKIKQAWKKGDFTEIGEILADKLNKALAKIPWAKVQAMARKVARSLATFINGFIGKADWELIAHTITTGLAVAIDAVATFVTTLNWRKIGKAIVNLVAGINWKALFKASAKLAGGLIGGFAGVFAGIASEIGKKVKKYFKKSIRDAGGSIVAGLLLGIARAIKNIGKFVKNNIFKPFINAFKKAFGISSPSKVMAKYGGYLIQGLFDGVKSGFNSLIGWFKKLPSEIEDAIGDGVFEIKAEVGTKWDDIKDDWNALTKNIKDKSVSFTAAVGTKWDDIKKKWNALTSNISGKTAQFKAAIATKWSDLKAKWKALKNKFTGKTAQLKFNIKAAVSSGYNAARKKINGFLDKLPSVIRPKWRLPELAQGGWIKKNTPQLAVVGDNRHESEIVAPDSKLAAMARQAANEASGGAGNAQVIALLAQLLAAVNNLDTNVYLDGKDITKNTIKNINQQTRMTGKSPILV